jgi:hypothetical protein
MITFKAVIVQLWKESVNSDGQQSYQYLQNEYLHLTSNHWTKQKDQTVYHVNPGPGMGQAHNVAGLNRLMIL